MTSGAAPLVLLEHVSCGYGGAPTVEAVDLRIDPDEFVGLVGPSGAGKTTILRAITGALTPVHGRVQRRTGLRLGYVPQLATIDWNFPVTVAEVAAMGLATRGWGPRLGAGGRRAVATSLDRLGIGDLAGRHVRRLSGGQQQRVFLARALVGEPDLVLLDEPTAGIDVRTRHEVLHLLADVHQQGITVVLTTHDLNGLAAHLPRIVCVNRTVVAAGPPAEVLRPYVLERTFGAPMEVLQHGGMPVVVDHPHLFTPAERRSA
ncbi:MAG: metal ABC transporter ATP-binding protein [Actinomycetota bacterium]|nr:metal ABC transporter ATP-binding protein [Actinomycetota bacterium]